jgi:hypothetical protein
VHRRKYETNGTRSLTVHDGELGAGSHRLRLPLRPGAYVCGITTDAGMASAHFVVVR